MTDNEIIKALEKLYDEAHKGYVTHLEHNGPRDTSHEEYIDLMSATFDLIQRQQERFDRIVEQLEGLPNVNSDYWNFSDLIDREDALEIVKGVQNEQIDKAKCRWNCMV